MKSLLFHREAENELQSAVDYYETQREGLGLELQSEIEKATTLILEHPGRYPLYEPIEGIRECLIRRFPYTIYFLELDDAIWIAAVAHQKRKPGYWIRRSPDDG